MYWHGLTNGASLSQILFKIRPTHCAAGFGSTCSKCTPGYTLMQSTPGSGRKACVPFCDPSVCSECGASNPRLCLGVCAAGYFKENSLCQRKCVFEAACHALCSECSSAASSPCSSCAPGAFLVAETASCLPLCPPSFRGDEATRACVACPANCEVCSASACSLCA